MLISLSSLLCNECSIITSQKQHRHFKISILYILSYKLLHWFVNHSWNIHVHVCSLKATLRLDLYMYLTYMLQYTICMSSDTVHIQNEVYLFFVSHRCWWSFRARRHWGKDCQETRAQVLVISHTYFSIVLIAPTCNAVLFVGAD